MVSKAMARLNKTMKARNMHGGPGGKASCPGSERNSLQLTRQETLSKLPSSRLLMEATDRTSLSGPQISETVAVSKASEILTVVKPVEGAENVPSRAQEWAEAIEQTDPDVLKAKTASHRGSSVCINGLNGLGGASGVFTPANGNGQASTSFPDSTTVTTLLRRLETKVSNVERQLASLASR